MILRPYQNEAVDAVWNEWKDHASTMAVLPTGTGKTIVMAELIRRCFPRRVMFLAHREELIFQAQQKIELVTGFKTDIEMGNLKTLVEGLYGDPQVIISTVQTQNSGGDGGGRMGKFLPDDYGYLFIDENHHSTAKSYRRVIDYYRQNPKLKVLGVTATPDRADEEALGQVFESVAYDYEILDAIHQGWLVPIEQQMIHVEGLDFSKVRTTAGDLNGADLSKVMELEQNLHGVADPTITISGDRRTLIFTVSVAQAESLANILNRHKPGSAAWVCGKTDKDERRQMLVDFAAGRIQYVVNVGCLTEGFDDPGVELIVMARLTKSRSLYAQMAGRATRPLPGIVDGLDTDDERKAAIAASAKPTCLILDFVGNSGRHRLMTSADILGGNVSDEVIEAAIERAKREGGAMRMDKLMDEEETLMRIEREKRRMKEAARKAHLVARAKFTATNIDPFDAYNITPQAGYAKDNGKRLTEKQGDVLLKIGIDPSALPYHQAKQILNEQFRRWHEHLCTIKQASLLRRYGYETKNLKIEEAGKLIDEIKKNGWKRAV